MPNLPPLIQRILVLIKRYPGVIALGGFISGVSSFILVDRQQGMASWTPKSSSGKSRNRCCAMPPR